MRTLMVVLSMATVAAAQDQVIHRLHGAARRVAAGHFAAGSATGGGPSDGAAAARTRRVAASIPDLAIDRSEIMHAS